ncbi:MULTISPECIES: prepilin-type N-terminal cleavage/methylation domain-containing protein [Acinetobacter]|nr:prepilin-type N-terminal cleavage/methylation domain-containing protein [Acinetobacter lwoffii]NWK62109.1 prepilin-type N-terminal cleavage/methylation domain-containing protein [Acinetobacter sp. SwsAc3]HAV6250166.1 prepilin-type N-terminal cleavage/methylation domain-containing protein [Acinetobacter baumannii]
MKNIFSQTGLTLIELIITIAILSLLLMMGSSLRQR